MKAKITARDFRKGNAGKAETTLTIMYSADLRILLWIAMLFIKIGTKIMNCRAVLTEIKKED